MVLFNFLKTWSITSSAGGSCTQRTVHVRMVSINGAQSSGIFAVASSDFGYGLGYPVMPIASFGRPARITRYCCWIVVRLRVRFVHRLEFARMPAAHVVAPLKS